MTFGTPLEDILMRLEERPPTIVSLVPSYTESLFDLGFGKWIAGVTHFCTRPGQGLENAQRVGGVWDVDVEKIIAIAPDVVIANQEENKPEIIFELEQAGIPGWVTFPQSVMDLFEVLGGMVRFYHDESASLRVRMLETSFDWAVQAAGEQPKVRYFCPIWEGEGAGGQRWWMTFNRNTYASDLLDQVGGENIFADRQRLYPLDADLGLASAEPSADRDTRYPRVSVDEIIAGQPQVIFLPDEPFQFDRASQEWMLKSLHDTPAVRAGRVYRIDGSLITWYGTRLGQALEDIPPYFMI